MKILQLEIKNIRGIVDLELIPEGENIVIWGPNGSGKSAVVDSIDFLLTGKISRLTGPGTAGLTLKRHGPHIDSTSNSSYVSALIKFPSLSTPIRIKRNIDLPNEIICDEQYQNDISPYLEMAERGQHVLTRKNILNFITSESSKRAKDIQLILNLNNIELIRKNLVTVRNNLGRNISECKKVVDERKKSLLSVVNIKKYDTDILLSYVNDKRRIFDGKDILEFKSDLLLSKIDHSIENTNSKNYTQVLEKCELLLSITPSIETSLEISNQIITKNAELNENEGLIKSFNLINLINLGLNSINNTGNCPLCDAIWEDNQLEDHLKSKLSELSSVKIIHDEYLSLQSKLLHNYTTLIDNLLQFVDLLESFDELDSINLEENIIHFKNKTTIINNLTRFSPEDISSLLDMSVIESINDQLLEFKKNPFLQTDPLQSKNEAWEILIRLEENLKGLETANKHLETSQLPYNRAVIVHDEFVKSRNLIVQSLYDSIRDQFVGLYRAIHNSDEDHFTATLEPKKAGIEFEVDFFGRGEFPPHALHSEGHQDSMGLCLYFALSNALTTGFIDLTILDDVVMSVDSEHRREICSIITKYYPKRQFLITTHDKTWAYQLKSSQVVKSKNLFEFFNWNINSGPTITYSQDLWEKIDQDLEKRDVNSAAAKLRRSSEAYFASVCDSLKAQIPYNISHRWDLGEYASSSKRQYSTLLKKAINSANSWNNDDLQSSLMELDSVKKQIYKKSEIEQWVINPTVHFTKWANLTPEDFRPVVDAFQDLWGLFSCPQCGNLLSVSFSSGSPVSVKCKCGTYNWNLERK